MKRPLLILVLIFTVAFLGAYTGNKIQGLVADGAASTANPLVVGGVDASGNSQQMLVGTDGSVSISALSSSIDSVTAVLNPTTTGGLSIYRNLDVGTTGASIKGSAGQIYGYYIYNNASATRYVKFYNSASAPTVGTTTPVMTLAIPAGGGANVSHPNGLTFSSGIGIGATTAIADNSTAIPSTNDVVVNVYFK